MARMNRPAPTTAMMAAVVVMACVPQAVGRPDLGANCASCHGTHRNALSFIGYDDLVSIRGRLDHGTTATLETFTATPGQTISLSFRVTNGNSLFALALLDLDEGGVRVDNTNELIYSADASWEERYNYYSTPIQSWPGHAETVEFELAIDADTPPDFYALTVNVGGISGGLWSDSAEFYVQVIEPAPIPGDFNDDGHVDLVDYMLFGYCFGGADENLPEGDTCLVADLDDDGDVDLADLSVLQASFTTP